MPTDAEAQLSTSKHSCSWGWCVEQCEYLASGLDSIPNPSILQMHTGEAAGDGLACLGPCNMQKTQLVFLVLGSWLQPNPALPGCCGHLALGQQMGELKKNV